MPESREQALARLSRETAAHVHAVALSSADAADHIRQSRKAIEHSLRLLARRWAGSDPYG